MTEVINKKSLPDRMRLLGVSNQLRNLQTLEVD